MLKNLIKKIFSSSTCIKYSQSILDIGQNNNIGDMFKNGEAWIITNYASKWSTVFDVGANIGNWSNLVSTQNQDAKIYAFEPVVETRNTLAQNILKNITIIPTALGDAPGTVTITKYSGDSGLNSISRKEISGVDKIGTEEIEITTLDLFCNKENITKIDMLKIDVEGHELKVLQGAEQMLTNGNIGMIQFEYGPAYIDSRSYLKDIFDFFKNKPYTLFKLMPNSLNRIDSYNFELETMRYSNYICIKND